MRGQVLELSRERFFREGREEGIEKGIEQGIKQGVANVIYKFMKKQSISFEEACRQCDIEENSSQTYRKYVEKMMEQDII